MTTQDDIFADLREYLASPQVRGLLARADELRGRLIRSILVVTGLFLICFVGARQIFDFLKIPLIDALPKNGTSAALNFTGPLDVFMCYMHVAFLCGAGLAMPYLAVQAWRFIAPALPDNYRKRSFAYITSSLLLFAVGVVFCFATILPMTLTFLITTGTEVAVPIITIEDYVSLLVFMLLGFGLVFQLPVVLVLAEAAGLLTLEHLTASRRVVFVVILIIAAVVTPTPDPFTQLAMAIPMYIMYEAAIVLIRSKHKRAAKAAASTGAIK